MSLGTSLVLAFIPVVASLLVASAARAQTPTGFTCQGQLSNSGLPPTGQADLRARLFTAQLDFGNVVDADQDHAEIDHLARETANLKARLGAIEAVLRNMEGDHR